MRLLIALTCALACIPPLPEPPASAPGDSDSSTPEPVELPPNQVRNWAQFTLVGATHSGLGLTMSAMSAQPAALDTSDPGAAETTSALAVGAPGTVGAEEASVQWMAWASLLGASQLFAMVLEDHEDGATPAQLPQRSGDYLAYIDGAGLVVGSAAESSLALQRDAQVLCWTSDSEEGEQDCDPATPAAVEGLGHATEGLGPMHVAVSSLSARMVRVVPLPGPLATTWDAGSIGWWYLPGPPSELGFSLAAIDLACSDGGPALAIGAPAFKGDVGRKIGEVYVVCNTLAQNQGVDLAADPSVLALENTAVAGGLGLQLLAADLGRGVVGAATPEADGVPDLVIAHEWWWTVVDGAWLSQRVAEGGRADIADGAMLSIDLVGEKDRDVLDTCHGMTAGDFDGDGDTDLAVAYCGDPDRLDRVFVLLDPLEATGTVDLYEAADLILVGNMPDDETGAALETISTRDGPDLLVVGAWQFDLAGDENQGKISIVDPCLFTDGFVPLSDNWACTEGD